jgi:hypothetical protein
MDYFSGLSTLIAGSVAWLVYHNQKKDEKRKAALVLLVEIRNAEERITQIRDQIANSSSADFPSVLSNRSWNRYSHLFVNDFDQDELKLINSFYDYAELIEDLGKRNNNFFWINTEERARANQWSNAQIIKELALGNCEELSSKIENIKKLYDSEFNKYYTDYTPQKTKSGIGIYLNKVQTITTSSCGIKLKKIAGLEK